MVAVVRAHVAQSVEHLHGKEKVIGSIPIVGSICMRREPLGAVGWQARVSPAHS